MAEAPEEKEQQPQKLSDRIENHRKEVQYLIKQGGEQPQYEFKRALSLGRESLDDRLDFVKLMQAVANAEITTERCIVIGADPKEKKFYPVTNTQEFDPANISKILCLYLDPLPRFEAFNLTTDDNKPLVLILLDANQPRPIIVTKAGQTEKGKTRLEVGEIWLKKNTDTIRATRADVDLMYKVRTEEEAEDRARKRLKHLLELTPAVQVPKAPEFIIPSFALLIGPKDDLRRFLDELNAKDDDRRFHMLLEVARDTLVGGWDRFQQSDTGLVLPENLNQFFYDLNDFYQNQFIPAFETVVEVALLMIKHNANRESVEVVVHLLLETFEACRNLSRLARGAVLQTGNSVLPWWKPAFEIYMGLRTIAIYSIIRDRLPYLGTILPRIVTRISPNESADSRTPVLFWPFYPSPFISGEFDHGRAQYFWKQRIGAAWMNYFGSVSKFIDGSYQLEFLLEFNSYLGTNSLNDRKFGEWLNTNVNDDFRYVPDLYTEDLQDTVPMAERMYEILLKGAPFPTHLFVDARFPLQVFGDIPQAQRMEVYGGFLQHLKAWQQTFLYQAFNRWGFMWDWSGRLKTIADSAKAQKAKRPAS